MNKNEPGGSFAVMNVTGNGEGNPVNTRRQPRIKAH